MYQCSYLCHKVTISMQIKVFTFNPFQENTYVLYENTKECIIVDPGCSNYEEENALKDFISSEKLKVVRLVNTHCHIDHILGNNFVHEEYGLLPEYSKKEIPVMELAKQSSLLYEIPYNDSPAAKNFIEEGELIEFGECKLEILSVPGHSPGHLVFVNKNDKRIIGGDVLFYGSIGRTDLPLGNHQDLINNIKQKLFSLDDGFMVYPGHGSETSLGFEKRSNPFLT